MLGWTSAGLIKCEAKDPVAAAFGYQRTLEYGLILETRMGAASNLEILALIAFTRYNKVDISWLPISKR